MRDIVQTLKISKSNVENHFYELSFISRLDVWVSHALTEANRVIRISTYDILAKHEESDPFLKRMITGDEKWIVYDNIKRERSWNHSDKLPQTIVKPDLYPKKVMLSIWWVYKSVMFHKLLPSNRTVNSEIYCEQLEKLQRSIEKKRPELLNRKGIVFHHNNARPQISLRTSQKIQQLGWDVLPHSPYSPDVVPTGFHLFRSLQNSLNGKNLNSKEAVKEHLERSFAGKVALNKIMDEDMSLREASVKYHIPKSTLFDQIKALKRGGLNREINEVGGMKPESSL
ncbi:histone-lysine N-methyltransferase SETMAR-like [Megalopta genalis]|uniref:histone-lysine N-methyltransferase SETMAR-like n=1 Tax=Megalopta genalis TaxID=115081 RepID=UPI003FD5B268